LPDFEPETLYDAWLKLEFAWMPYNLLLTREWMLVVPRSRESVDGISVNSLGFAGALLAKDEAERETILQQGPMNLLAAVSCEA
jgi:ATP adenylyltransferase